MQQLLIEELPPSFAETGLISMIELFLSLISITG
jgi:hypothetical protein